MMQKKSKLPKETETTHGPEPELLKIDVDWQEAIKKSLAKKKPAAGWPKEK